MSSSKNLYVYTEESSIPDLAYVRVDYIESTGTQYIDTGIALNQDSRAELKLKGLTAGQIAKIFGSRTKATENNFSILTRYDSEKKETSLVCDFRNSQEPKHRLSVVVTDFNDEFVISMSNSELKINDVFNTFSDTTPFTAPGNAYIFNANGTWPAGSILSSTKVFYCKIWSGANLVRSFVPCYRKSDNVAGLYDLVHSQFYGNSGTGSFTPGPTSSHSIGMWKSVQA